MTDDTMDDRIAQVIATYRREPLDPRSASKFCEFCEHIMASGEPESHDSTCPVPLARDVQRLTGERDLALTDRDLWRIMHRDEEDDANRLRRALTGALSEVQRLRELLAASNPGQSCGADPRVSPASGAELPIIAGALDAKSKVKSGTMEVRTYAVIARAVGEGVRAGWRRGHKHVENPSPEVVQEHIEREVMNAICEWFEFE